MDEEGKRERRNRAGGIHCQGHSSLLREFSCTRMILFAEQSVRCKRSETACRLYTFREEIQTICDYTKLCIANTGRENAFLIRSKVLGLPFKNIQDFLPIKTSLDPVKLPLHILSLATEISK